MRIARGVFRLDERLKGEVRVVERAVALPEVPRRAPEDDAHLRGRTVEINMLDAVSGGAAVPLCTATARAAADLELRLQLVGTSPVNSQARAAQSVCGRVLQCIVVRARLDSAASRRP
jgi:hypothetical protein